MELQMETSFIKRKKREFQKVVNLELHLFDDVNSHIKESNTDNAIKHITPNSISKTSDSEKSFNLFNSAEQKKIQNASTKNLENFASKSIDVIVDIHQDHEKIKSTVEDIKRNEILNTKTVDISLNKSKSFEVLPQTKIHHNKRNKINNQKVKKNYNDIQTADSLDLIEEIQEPIQNKKNATKFKTTKKGKSLKKDNHESSSEKKTNSRRQWNISKNQILEQTKQPRKRWLKDTSIICLLDTECNSWTSSMTKGTSSFNENIEQSFPVAQSSLNQKAIFGYNNAGFILENEDILKIETDYDQGTNIEMKEMINECKKTDISSSYSQSSLNSSNENNILEETLHTVESANKFKDISHIQNRKQKFKKHSYDNVSSKSRTSSGSENKKIDSNRNNKRDSDDLFTLQTSNEDMKQSKYSLSEETPIKKDKLCTNKKVKKKDIKHFNKEQSLSNSHTVSTTDEDHNSKKVHDKNKLKKLNYVKSSTEVSNNHKDLEKKKKKEVKYISIVIHKADVLEIDYITKHPMVKVHIINIQTGKYLKSENMNLQPLITRKCDFMENKSIKPIWEEELIFEHDFNDLLKVDNEQVVILFEIIDVLNFSNASINYDKYGREGCFYKIAWAFLKPIGKNNVLHVRKKVRLQLYKPQKTSKKLNKLDTCDVYTWWKTKNREKYPCSLFVSVASVDPPKSEPVFYQQFSLCDLSNVYNESHEASTHTLDSINLPKWTRLAAQSCKIPNDNIFETDISENGCFFVAFSNNGKYLACTLSDEHNYRIIVYKIEDKRVYIRFLGHKTFIYSLHWSSNDNYLLSVSSDQTACIWDLQNQITQQIEMMPHPSYVYCGKFDPKNASTVATGCYDRIARIWIQHKKSKNYNLHQELEGHEGFINSMCFQKNYNLLTADSVGVIIIWAVKENQGTTRKHWHILKKIKMNDIYGTIINTIVLHPLESRLLVHLRNNRLQMLDLTTGAILQKYNGLNNQRIQSTACISPCGGLIFCGNEDSSLNVWNLETGNLVAKYTFDNSRAISCVDYHPYDHILAFSTFGYPAPVRVLKFNKDVSGENIGLKMVAKSKVKINCSDTSVRVLNSSLLSRRSQISTVTETLEEISKKENLQSSRSYNSSRFNAFENIPTKEGNTYDTKEEFQYLNITEQTLNSRSANRLYNIIEKIDRILINSSRSSDDVESGKNCISGVEKNKNNSSIIKNENMKEDETKQGKIKSLVHLSNENYLNMHGVEFSTSSVQQEKFDLQNMNKYHWNREKRSQCANVVTESKLHDNNLRKSLSDNSTKDYQNVKASNRIMKNVQNKSANSCSITQVEANNLKSTISYEDDCFSTDSSSDTAETYVVKKNDVHGQNNQNLEKIFENEHLSKNHKKFNSNEVKRSESECSNVSNATFTIENEVPTPKAKIKSIFT